MASQKRTQFSPFALNALSVVHIPLRHGFISMLGLFCVPAVGYQVVLITQAPWWNLPLQALALWMGLFFLVTLVIIYRQLRSKPWANLALRVFFGLWSAASIFLALQTRATSLAFFALAQSALAWIYVSVVEREFARSYLDPKCRWYQGTPEFIPTLKVWMVQDSTQVPPAEISNPVEAAGSIAVIDFDGAYAFFPKMAAQALRSLTQIKIARAGAELILPVQVISMLERASGVGLRFRVNQMNADEKKHLYDFLYSLEGEGFCEIR